MKILFTTALALTVASFAFTAIAETTKYSTKGLHTNASWYESDDCSYESLSVSASEAISRQTGTPSTTSTFIGVSYSYSNWCTGQYESRYGSGEGVVAGGLNSVEVEGSIPFFNYVTNELSTVSVDLTFTSNGEYSSRGTSNFVYVTGPVRNRYRSVGSFESANVSGTVVEDGENLADLPLSWAEIGKISNGTLEIVKPGA